MAIADIAKTLLKRVSSAWGAIPRTLAEGAAKTSVKFSEMKAQDIRTMGRDILRRTTGASSVGEFQKSISGSGLAANAQRAYKTFRGNKIIQSFSKNRQSLGNLRMVKGMRGGARAIAGKALSHPFIVGGTVGLGLGAISSGMRMADQRTQTIRTRRSMGPNYLGTDGLTISLSKLRHR